MGNILRIIQHELSSAGTGTMVAIIGHMILLSLLSFFQLSFFARVIYFVIFTSFVASVRYVRDLGIFPEYILERLVSNIVFLMMIAWFVVLLYEKVLKRDSEFMALYKKDLSIPSMIIRIGELSITLALVLVLVYLLSLTLLMTIYRIVLTTGELIVRTFSGK